MSGSTHFCTIFQAPQAKFLKIWPFSLKYARILPIFDKTDPLMYAVSKTRPTHVRTFWISKPTLIGSSWYPRIYWSTPPGLQLCISKNHNCSSYDSVDGRAGKSGSSVRPFFASDLKSDFGFDGQIRPVGIGFSAKSSNWAWIRGILEVGFSDLAILKSRIVGSWVPPAHPPLLT